MAVRIQLASNFQVVELNFDTWSEIDIDEIEAATALVNKLGRDVVNDIKTNKPAQKKVEKKVERKFDETEMATEAQIDWLLELGVEEKVAKKMTKSEAWHYINDNK